MNHLPPEPNALEVLELRQYTLHPGQRDVVIDLFDREFPEAQDAVGMPVLGQFRDLDDPDRLVWLRGFSTMQTRHEALSAFDGGPVWQTHRELANATMIDSDNVLLLRPACAGAHFPLIRVCGPKRGYQRFRQAWLISRFSIRSNRLSVICSRFSGNRWPRSCTKEAPYARLGMSTKPVKTLLQVFLCAPGNACLSGWHFLRMCARVKASVRRGHGSKRSHRNCKPVCANPLNRFVWCQLHDRLCMPER